MGRTRRIRSARPARSSRPSLLSRLAAYLLIIKFDRGGPNRDGHVPAIRYTATAR